MALVFPLAMPVGGVDSQEFDIERNDRVSPENRGRVNSTAIGFPLWRMLINLGVTTEDEADAWSAFKDALRGGGRHFYGCDLSRPYPKAYPQGLAGMTRAGGGAFNGAASTWSLNEARDVISMTGLPEGFTLGLRDYIGFKWGVSNNRRALVRTVETAIADGDGELVVTVEPPVPGGDAVALVAEDAVLHFDNPKCLMKLISQQTRLGARDVLHSQGGTIAAVQDLLA